MDGAKRIEVALDLNGREYPDVAAVAILHLLSVERLRLHPGYERARHWGVGPHHETLRDLGLVTIGTPESTGGTRPVDLTDDGRDVAEMVGGLRRGLLFPVRCRVCGQLCGADYSLCERCADHTASELDAAEGQGRRQP
jgi:hypothetical protein